MSDLKLLTVLWMFTSIMTGVGGLALTHYTVGLQQRIEELEGE